MSEFYKSFDEYELFDYLSGNLAFEAEYMDGHVNSVRISLKLKYVSLPNEWHEIGSVEVMIPEKDVYS